MGGLILPLARPATTFRTLLRCEYGNSRMETLAITITRFLKLYLHKYAQKTPGLRQHIAGRVQHCRKGKNSSVPHFLHSNYFSAIRASNLQTHPLLTCLCTLSCLKVAEIKDNQIRGTLKNLETSIHHWDSEKCPAVK